MNKKNGLGDQKDNHLNGFFGLCEKPVDGEIVAKHSDAFALAGTDKKYIERRQDRVTFHNLARMS